MLNFILAIISGCLIYFNIQLMWNWFVVPLGAIPISYLHAGALFCSAQYIISLSKNKLVDSKKISTKEFTAELGTRIAFSLIVMLISWVFHSCI